MRHPINLEALADLFAHRIARVSDLVHIGLAVSFIMNRCGPSGPWQRLLPGIVLLGKAPPTRAQLIYGALRYAGPHTIVTGLDALQLHGMHAVPATGPIHVLAPLRAAVPGCTEVHVERTGRPPRPVLRKGFLIAPPARAAIDAVRRIRTAIDIQSILDEVGEFTDPAELRTELDEAPRRGTAMAREILTPKPLALHR